MHQRKCKAEINQDVKEEETEGEEEDDDDEPEQNEQEEDEPEQPPNGFLEFSVNMVYVWCKQMLKRRKEAFEVKETFEN